MKKKNTIITLFCTLLSCVSCNFLEVDPELGLTEEDVFSTYKNYRLYFDYTQTSNKELFVRLISYTIKVH